MIYYDYIESPVGLLLATGDGENITGLYLENHKGGPTVGPDWRREAEPFEKLREQLRAYFAGERSQFDLPLNLEGTVFQKAVWQQLTTIPHGQTITYGDIAKTLGSPTASRAVGAAVGRNPVSIVVPCHRVLGASGAITGYAGGVERKQTLLSLERASLV